MAWGGMSVGLATGLCTLALGTVSYYLWKLELFTSVKITEETVGPFVCVYTNFVGPYHNVGSPMMKVYNDVRDKCAAYAGQLRMFGVYYDKPDEIPPEKCRASVGVIVKQDDSLESLQAVRDELNKDLNLSEDEHLKVAVFPASRFVFCKLPFHGWLSVIVAIMRSYPALSVAMAAVCDQSKHDQDVQVYGSMEIYHREECWMKIGFPLNVREVLLPFDIKTE